MNYLNSRASAYDPVAEADNIPETNVLVKPEIEVSGSVREKLAVKINHDIDLIRLFRTTDSDKGERCEVRIPNDINKPLALGRYDSNYKAIYKRPTEGKALLTLERGDASKIYTFNREKGLIERIEILVDGKLPRTLECEDLSYRELLGLTTILKDFG